MDYALDCVSTLWENGSGRYQSSRALFLKAHHRLQLSVTAGNMCLSCARVCLLLGGEGEGYM